MRGALRTLKNEKRKKRNQKKNRKLMKNKNKGERMDLLLRYLENSTRNGMQFQSNMFHFLGTLMDTNPFIDKTWADAVTDYGSFLKEKANPILRNPWLTENKIDYRGQKTILRRFSSGDMGNPVLLVPPEAGHNSQIVDYGPEQSLVQCALENHTGDVYAMDKLPAGPQHTDYSIEDCIRSLGECIRTIGQPVHLVGLCQGGWQAVAYAALFPEHVKSLTLAGAPIDFHAGDGLISQMAQTLPLSFYQSLVNMGSGLMPGAFIAAGFKMMNAFERFMGEDFKLYQNINDPEYLDRNRRFNQWYEFTQPLGGRMYLEVIEHLFKANKLVKGDLEIMGRKVDLSAIHQPIYLIAGTKDDITPPEQLFAIRHFVSSTSITETLAEAGHIGVFMKSKVIDEIWSELYANLSAFSCEYTFDWDNHMLEEDAIRQIEEFV
jgi:poly(3-hydroxybutyrate) depolymerase